MYQVILLLLYEIKALSNFHKRKPFDLDGGYLHKLILLSDTGLFELQR